MKQLTCDMCGGTDLIKDGGVFVCQTCGCKYSVEEARKMMIEGTVQVQGTVQVDTSSFVEKYLQNARRAKAKQDWEETEKYYNMVEQNEPDNIEAIFYSSYGKARLSLLVNDQFKRQQVFQVLINCVSIIDDNYNVAKSEELVEVIQGMSRDIMDIRKCDFLFTWFNNNGRVTNNRNETITLFNDLDAHFIESVENIIKVDEQVYLYEIIKAHCDVLIQKGNLADYHQNSWRRKRDDAMKAEEELSVRQRKERIEAYWAEHGDERNALENEKSQLKGRLDELKSEMENVPGMSDIKALEERKRALEDEIDHLGIFKGREKRAKEQEIEVLRSRIAEVRESMAPAVKEVEERTYAVKRRILDITRELTKDRRQE